MVKVYDVSSWKVVHSMRYPAPVLCLAVSVSFLSVPSLNWLTHGRKPDDTHIAAGMSDGTFSIRRRQPKAAEASIPGLPSSLPIGEIPSKLISDKAKGKAKAIPTREGEFRLESHRKKKLKPYDRLLKDFKYSAALDSVLRSVRCYFSFSSFLQLMTCSLTPK
jgi:U3 small nucleolar RNA-associated protein 15